VTILSESDILLIGQTGRATPEQVRALAEKILINDGYAPKRRQRFRVVQGGKR
jgi:hypothetical protein